MATQDRRCMTLSCLVEESITPAALGIMLRLHHHYCNNPVSIQQVMDLFDHPPDSVSSNEQKHDILDELITKGLLHRYAFLGAIKHQSRLCLLAEGEQPIVEKGEDSRD